MGCPVYHSQLPDDGPISKQVVLDCWDKGKSLLIASTSGLAQGINWPYIKYVIFHDTYYGLGWAGREG